MGEGRNRPRYDLATLTAAEAVLLGALAARDTKEASSLEEAADLIVKRLHASLWNSAQDRPATALVRFYRTISFDQLEAHLKPIAASMLARSVDPPNSSIKSLTLMGTAGLEPRWNSRHNSQSHRVIPLPSSAAIQRLPMVARLVHDMGVPVDALVGKTDDTTSTSDSKRTSLLHIREAAGDRHVPDQDSFVLPYGIRSVVGFGGQLGSADLWAVILFCRVSVTPEVARLIRVLGSDVKLAIVPLLTSRLFAV